MTLEQLLNKLIEKGYRPFGKKVSKYVSNLGYISFMQYSKDDVYIGSFTKTKRELVSKESGLWQFVCENRLYNPNNRGYWGNREYEYYLLESALCDEDKLESFILDNIKIDE